MSMHPNVLLMLALTPDDLSRKTFRAICADCGVDPDSYEGRPSIKIGENNYSIRVMETDYDESFQISAREGDLLLCDLVTYGYGEHIEWTKLSKLKEELEEWAKRICERHACKYTILVGANFW